MALFGKKKPVKKEVKVIKRRADALIDLVECFRIGSRIRFSTDFEGKIMLETLVLGYCIEGEYVFQQKNLSFDNDGNESTLTVKSKRGEVTHSRISEFFLILPADINLDAQLDTESRAELGSRGPFTRGNFLKLMSFNPGRDNVSCSAEVQRTLKLTGGMHSGRLAVQVEVGLGTIEEFEPRSESRVNIQVPVEFYFNDEDTPMRAEMLDFSESALRLGLVEMDTRWPGFGKRDVAIIFFKMPGSGQPVKLECKCINKRHNERIFEVSRIYRHGQFMAFSSMDALELKINLLNDAEL